MMCELYCNPHAYQVFHDEEFMTESASYCPSAFSISFSVGKVMVSK